MSTEANWEYMSKHRSCAKVSVKCSMRNEPMDKIDLWQKLQHHVNRLNIYFSCHGFLMQHRQYVQNLPPFHISVWCLTVCPLRPDWFFSSSFRNGFSTMRVTMQEERKGTCGKVEAACHMWLYQMAIHISDIARTAGGWLAGLAHRVWVHWDQ